MMFDTSTSYPSMSAGPMFTNPHALPSCSMMAKTQQSVSQPPPPPPPNTSSRESDTVKRVSEMDFDDSFDEEEDFSEDDCEMDHEDCGEPTDNTVTQQLLRFADRVNSDIKKYFGRRKGDEDSCDIYEDKWTSNKSGRELYYADLLRVAQGEDVEDRRQSTSRDTPQDSTSSNHTYTGRADRDAGLGPLQELFENIPTGIPLTTAGRPAVKKLKTSSLSGRKLPSSFWVEPLEKDKNETEKKSASLVKDTVKTSSVLLGHSKTPDFTDLLESWTGEDGGHIGSSDMVSSQPEQDHNHRR